MPGLQAGLRVEAAPITLGRCLHLAATELGVAIPTLAAMIAPTGDLHATPMTPDRIGSVPPVVVRTPGEGPLQGVQPREGTGVPVMSRVHTVSMTGVVEIARRVETIMPPTVATTEVAEAVIPVEPADMMSEVNACRLAALSKRHGRLQGVAQAWCAIAPDPVVI